jgi:hypothetical protein
MMKLSADVGLMGAYDGTWSVERFDQFYMVSKLPSLDFHHRVIGDSLDYLPSYSSHVLTLVYDRVIDVEWMVTELKHGT